VAITVAAADAAAAGTEAADAGDKGRNCE
jgi:hypothetical protein